MGVGDELIATGFARGAAARGKRIAFGNGQEIIWSWRSEKIFEGNPNIAPPGSEGDSDIEWHPFCIGNRLYNMHDPKNNRWIWNYGFRAPPGEVFFTSEEQRFGGKFGGDFVVIEPNALTKPSSQNKQWPIARYQRIARALKDNGFDVRQFHYEGMRHELPGVRQINTPTFRHALAVLRTTKLLLTCEGGMHHGAAAVGIPAVVLFGGFIPPEATGYDTHVNLAMPPACGTIGPCEHCTRAMHSISVDSVLTAMWGILNAASFRDSGAGGVPAGLPANGG